MFKPKVIKRQEVEEQDPEEDMEEEVEEVEEVEEEEVEEQPRTREVKGVPRKPVQKPQITNQEVLDAAKAHIQRAFALLDAMYLGA